MPKLNRNALSAQMVRHAGPGSYVDGNGLMLRVRDSGSRAWVQRIMVHGRRVDIGLGNAELVSLAEARRIAADNRAVARTGGDPRKAKTISFAEAEPRAMAEKAETWRRGTASKSLRDWRSTMDTYVLPQLGKMHVSAVATSDVKRVLRPLALAGKHATMRMVAGRIVAVLEWAEVENLREPAGSGRAIVETVTRSQPKAAAVRHHRALHFSDVAEALKKVDAHPRVARSVQLAIRFGVLTAARQAEVRRATWDEFDLDEAVWTVPEAHMKRYRPHWVPLSTGALAALEESRNMNGHGEFAFRGTQGGKLGRAAVADALRKAKINATGHGFRSSFKDWARHEGVDEILSEFALAHVEGSKTVAACARDDLLEKRRPVMQAWCDYLTAAPGA
ncbi:MAG: integrase arm-type DNA-binding domain-containing protein [Gammaproteobacteria bacterium]|nr:integrase arm-type DNA-binding domain-containing protein [Gammaproteobacteria bacterium]